MKAQEEIDKEKRIIQWRFDMMEDVKKARRYMKAQPDKEAPKKELNTPAHPQKRAEKLRQDLEDMFRAGEFFEEIKGEREIEDLMTWVPRGGFEGARICIDAWTMKRKAGNGRGKAGGLDRWTGTDVANLPLTFFERVKDLWEMVLKVGKVPWTWLQVKNVAIDKEDGGDRWLSIAAVLWRLGMAERRSLTWPEKLGWTRHGTRNRGCRRRLRYSKRRDRKRGRTRRL